MSRVLSAVLVLFLSVLMGTAQQAAPAPKAANQNEVHATIPVQLAKSLDAKKLKTGDEVIAQTTVPLQGNGATVPSGSKVIGHVTQAQARSKGDPQSSLGIVFDKIEVPGGKELPMQGYIQAVAPGLAAAPSTGLAGGGTMARDNGSQQGNTVPGPGSTLGNIKGTNPQLSGDEGHNPGTTNQGPLLNPDSHGVVGFRHLDLNKDSVLTTTDKDLKLDSGTQLLIRTEVKQSAQSQ
jgi:hypothetical protein